MSRNRLESPMTALHPLLFLALFLAALTMGPTPQSPGWGPAAAWADDDDDRDDNDDDDDDWE